MTIQGRDLSQREFIALMALAFAIMAFSIDAMLPALGLIAQELSPAAPNQAQLVVTAFIFGMGAGTLVTGPLSDSFGRRPVMFGGLALYTLGALLARMAPSLEVMIAARVLQGLGAAGPRVVGVAVVRDMFRGRQMARIMSLVLMVFTLAPVLAPSLGAVVMGVFGWRSIFLSFVIFAAVLAVWIAWRLPETLPPGDRRAFRLGPLAAAAVETLSDRQVLIATAAQTLIFGILFSVLTSSQQIFAVVFDRGESFPLWFGAIALFSGSASLLNASLVQRLGMRFLVRVSLSGQMMLTSVMVVLFGLGLLPAGLEFPAWVLWQTSVFFMAGLTIGNLNALAMAPLGHIAGMAASVIGSASTVVSMVVAIPVGLAFDGSVLPVIGGVFISGLLALGLVFALGDERQEEPQPVAAERSGQGPPPGQRDPRRR